MTKFKLLLVMLTIIFSPLVKSQGDAAKKMKMRAEAISVIDSYQIDIYELNVELGQEKERNSSNPFYSIVDLRIEQIEAGLKGDIAFFERRGMVSESGRALIEAGRESDLVKQIIEYYEDVYTDFRVQFTHAFYVKSIGKAYLRQVITKTFEGSLESESYTFEFRRNSDGSWNYIPRVTDDFKLFSRFIESKFPFDRTEYSYSQGRFQ